MLKAQCPACSAPIEFANKASLYAVCGYCGVSSLREDINLKALGKVAELQDDGSVIQLGTTGIHEGRSFRVVGRIQRAYARGFWNDWHLSFGDGDPGWLSEAMGHYSVLFDAPAGGLPAGAKLMLGQAVKIGDGTYFVKSKLQGECVGVEGELPFEFPGSSAGLFVDLAAEQCRCATIMYLGSAVRAFTGSYVPFEKLQLKDIRRPEGW